MHLSGFGTWITLATFLAGSSLQAADNLLKNPGFEQGLEGWWTFGEGWCAGSDGGTTGAAAMNDVPTGCTNAEWRGICQTVPVIPWARYACAASIQASGAGPSQTYLEIQFLDSSERVLQNYQSHVIASDQPFTLTTLNNLAAPAKAVAALVRGVVHLRDLPTGAPSHFCFDTFEFHEVSRPAVLPTAVPVPVLTVGSK